MKPNSINLPNGKKFAFSIFDDTDMATIDNIKPIYELLLNLGFRTTKSVWSLPNYGHQTLTDKGQTLSDPEYLSFILKLRDEGFEIGFHGASDGNSERIETIKALDVFKDLIGYYPKTYVNHLNNIESLYWGIDRIDSFFIKLFYKLYNLKKQKFCGHIPDSKYFWGDIAQKYITYTRNFVFSDINTIKFNPSMPYYDPLRPYVNFWFSSSNGLNVNTFNKLLSEENQYKLESERGICIVYTHFAFDFVKDGKVNPITEYLLTKLSRREGWFVPVGTLLDYLKSQRNHYLCPEFEKVKMEFFWFFDKIIHKDNH